MASGNMQYGNNANTTGVNDSAAAFTTLTSTVTTTPANEATLVITNTAAGNALRGLSQQGFGVSGSSQRAPGVFGVSANSDGVRGSSTGRNGVQGVSQSQVASGVYGENLSGRGFGVAGRSNSPSPGDDIPRGAAVLGDNPAGGYAGLFVGNVHVDGFFTKSGGGFRIDHPTDPANKYLCHSFVESPEMLNVYSGQVTTDEDGRATVALPDYFESLNRDFRYQLTVVGLFAQAIVAEEIRENRFVISTDKPGVKVSWQVVGVRQDPWARAHAITTEIEKSKPDRGKYLAPQEYGEPASSGIYFSESIGYLDQGE
jgi:hypothetical protein